MPDVVLIVDAEVDDRGYLIQPASAVGQIVSAMQQAILTDSNDPVTFALLSTATLAQTYADVATFLHSQLAELAHPPDLQFGDLQLCPLTLHLPDSFRFPEQSLFQACRDVTGLRQRVAQHLGYATGDGSFWLPILLTAKGPLYCEVIGLNPPPIEPETWNPSEATRYCQPIHLSDRWRQPLYRLGHDLLQGLSATPATYLLQFGFTQTEIVFDRLWPFPAAPALASLKIQQPNLFVGHWRCLTRQPILDVTIPATVAYQVYGAS